MKFIHTSDWHLGQILMGKSREEEHKLFLDWLLKEIENEKADLLIIAGDVFDTATPPVYAQKLYFEFLSRTVRTSCEKIVVAAGNHDSVSLLEASKELLSFFNVKVVTKEAEILEFDDAILIAVPFLREKFLLKALRNKTAKEDEKRVVNAVKEYYDLLYRKALKIARNRPIVATGHLSVTGSESSGSEREIYIGNLSSIESDFFKERFDYTALGHFHKKQSFGKSVAYCGSPIPLNFKESRFKKAVLSVEISKGKLSVKEIEVPAFRKLFSLKTPSLEKETLFKEIPENSWVEIVLEGENEGEFIYEEIKEAAKEKNIEVLAVKCERENEPSLSFENENIFIEDLSPLAVFRKRIEQDTDEEEKRELEALFLKILNETELKEEDEDQ